ncbi:MAG: DUF308 domain-containing protein [Methanobrevibacter boviskoreani]|jgi:uncharacterized membrane protein HdeD (DUF308 family)|uniref:DUF308 domain-containing protein n=1 Tax=Methanobrevibacter boviskoreani TaxID=1348249 RepID=UPI003D8F3D31
MKNEIMSIIALILGIILIAFPILGYIGVNSICGLSILLIAIYLLLSGVNEVDYQFVKSILNTIIGLILLIISIFILFNPNLIISFNGIIPYLVGIFLIIIGLIGIISDRESKYGFYIGILGIVLGLVYLIIVLFMSNQIILGSIVGIWLIICGLLKFIDRY